MTAEPGAEQYVAEWHIKQLAGRLGGELPSSVDGPTLRRAAEALLLHYGYVRPERLATLAATLARVQALCDDPDDVQEWERVENVFDRVAVVDVQRIRAALGGVS